MSGDVDSNLSYSAVVENMGVAVEISLIVRSVPNRHPLPVLANATKIGWALGRPGLKECCPQSREEYKKKCQKFHLVIAASIISNQFWSISTRTTTKNHQAHGALP